MLLYICFPDDSTLWTTKNLQFNLQLQDGWNWFWGRVTRTCPTAGSSTSSTSLVPAALPLTDNQVAMDRPDLDNPAQLQDVNTLQSSYWSPQWNTDRLITTSLWSWRRASPSPAITDRPPGSRSGRGWGLKLGDKLNMWRCGQSGAELIYLMLVLSEYPREEMMWSHGGRIKRLDWNIQTEFTLYITAVFHWCPFFSIVIIESSQWSWSTDLLVEWKKNRWQMNNWSKCEIK